MTGVAEWQSILVRALVRADSADFGKTDEGTDEDDDDDVSMMLIATGSTHTTCSQLQEGQDRDCKVTWSFIHALVASCMMTSASIAIGANMSLLQVSPIMTT